MSGGRRTIEGMSLLLLVLVAATGSLAAQEEDEPGERRDERCVCVEVDVDEVREQVRDAMERVREHVEAVRIDFGRRARLGIGIDHAQATRWDTVGVRVERVSEDGPAAGAGLREGDVIVALDGRELTRPLPDPELEDDLDPEASAPVQRLVLLLRDREPGDEVELEYLREGERRSTRVELTSERELMRSRAPDALQGVRVPPRPGAAHPGRPPGPRELRWTEACGRLEGFAGPNCVAGLEVRSLGPHLGRYFGTEDGVVVLQVAEGSTLGLRPGDVILGVGDRAVDEPRDLRRHLRSHAEGEEVRFRIRRDGREFTVTGTLE